MTSFTAYHEKLLHTSFDAENAYFKKHFKDNYLSLFPPDERYEKKYLIQSYTPKSNISTVYNYNLMKINID